MAQSTTNTIQFPYRRSLGPVVGAFMTALGEGRILGVRAGDRVLVPPLEWDPATGERLGDDLVEVGPAGTVTSWTWVAEPTVQHPLDRPFAFALIRLDGADSALLHAVDVGSLDAMSSGMRVAPRWRAEPRGRIDDIECFVAGDTPQGQPATSAEEPVTMMDYAASITYRDTVPPNVARVLEASKEHRLIGHRCSVCGRTYSGGRGFCPVDAIQLGPNDERELPQRGTVTNFTVVTPVQYPGQTETEPFVRAMVLLDDAGVIMSYQPIVDLPAEQVRVGLRVEARWARPTDEALHAPGMGGAVGLLEGWAPTGEDDVDDPDLVNRIF